MGNQAGGVISSNIDRFQNGEKFTLGQVSIDVATIFLDILAIKLSVDEAKKIEEALKALNAAKNIGNSWYNADGSINYPPNGGAVAGSQETITLQPGGKLGRYGEVTPGSHYVTDVGSAPNSLALPPNTNPAQYYEYIIVKPIPNTIKATIAEWPIGSGTGGGFQYEMPDTILNLEQNGFIIKIK